MLTCATIDTSPPASPSATVTRPRNGPVQSRVGMDPLPRGPRRAASTTCPRRRSREVVIRRRIWDGRTGRDRVALEEAEGNRVRSGWRASPVESPLSLVAGESPNPLPVWALTRSSAATRHPQVPPRQEPQSLPRPRNRSSRSRLVRPASPYKSPSTPNYRFRLRTNWSRTRRESP